jgi:hypothetical protein
MAYIGREPQIGNFQVCDAISVVNGQAAYTMQVSSVNVSPETANHMIVSLNGIIQAPGSSYTVSGSTITFASNLVTGDVINFIHILGSVLDLGVPSDSTVSLAKLTATGTKDATTFLRGDNTFAVPPSITVVQQFRLNADVSGSGSTGTVLTSWEENDTDYQAIGSAWSQSSGIFSTTTTGIYQLNWTFVVSGSAGNDAYDPDIQISTDSGSNYNTRSLIWNYSDASGSRRSSANTLIFDVANTSTFRLRFRQSNSNSVATGTTIHGSTSLSATQMTFVRLGNT